jgi:protein SCO1/2/putative membrane protein
MRQTPRRLAAVLLGLLCLLGAASCAPQRPSPSDIDLGPVGDFSLTECSGRTVTAADLRGKVWVASFQFTRCTGPCPQVSRTMKRLQDELADRPDLLLVTFTVDPEHDNPEELTRYAERLGAGPDRWLFLTGKEDEVYRLCKDGFHVFAKPNTGAERQPGAEVAHDTRLVVVDRAGHVRGYFDGLPDSRSPTPEADFEVNLRRLRRRVDALVYEPPAFLPRDVPRFNATLNGLSAALLLLGYAAVRQRRVRLHAACMLSALAVSALFLASYLYFHLVIKAGKATRFTEQAPDAPDWVQYLYLAVLGTHTVLAIFAAPLALYTAYQGLRGHVARHVGVARWTLPIWLYVSVTGVVVYVMLYRLYPGP